MNNYEDEEDEFLRIALTGLNYPFNTNTSLALTKQKLEREVLEKLSDKLDDDFDDDDDDDGEDFG